MKRHLLLQGFQKGFKRDVSLKGEGQYLSLCMLSQIYQPGQRTNCANIAWFCLPSVAQHLHISCQPLLDTQHFSTLPQTLWIRKMVGWRGMSNSILAIEMYSHLCSSVSNILLTVVMMTCFTFQLGRLVPLLQPFAGVWDYMPYHMQLGSCHMHHPTKAWCPGRAPETLYTHATRSLQHTPKRAAPHFRK